MKRRLLAILLVLALVCTLAFSLTACNGSGSVDNGEGEQIEEGGKTPGVDVPGVDDPDASGSNDDDYVRG